MAEITNAIDLLALDLMKNDVRAECIRSFKTGWSFTALAAALNSYHARGVIAREVTHG
jgi:hypothetical protein